MGYYKWGELALKFVKFVAVLLNSTHKVALMYCAAYIGL